MHSTHEGPFLQLIQLLIAEQGTQAGTGMVVSRAKLALQLIQKGPFSQAAQFGSEHETHDMLELAKSK
jgi:hypothetical protein